MNISKWFPTAASNTSASPDGFPLGNICPWKFGPTFRELMAAIRRQFERLGWFDWGDTVTYVNATSFTVPGDRSGVYKKGAPLEASGAATGTIYGEVAQDAAYDGGTDKTTVTAVWDSGSLQNETLTIAVGSIGADTASVPGRAVRHSMASSVASAATLVPPDDGEASHITGTTAVTAIEARHRGYVWETIFDGSLTLTYSANLLLLSGSDITTQAGSVARWRSEGGGVWRMISYHQADGTPLVASSRVTVQRSQTTLVGVCDANGYADFLRIGTGLSVNLLATATPLRVAFAAGYDSGGNLDYQGIVPADVPAAWSALTANSTLYLYVERDPGTGGISYGFSSLQQAYGYAHPGSPADGQHSYLIQHRKMYYYDGVGATWVAVQRRFVGECTTDASGVTSVTTYALNGRYESPRFTIDPLQVYDYAHRIGLEPPDVRAFARKDSAHNWMPYSYITYSPNDTTQHGATLRVSYIAIELVTSNVIGMPWSDNGNYPAFSAYTDAQGEAYLVADRGWD